MSLWGCLQGRVQGLARAGFGFNFRVVIAPEVTGEVPLG
jgi:hypothetical protein